MAPGEENFQIAQEFMTNRLENNPFADTNENAVDKAM